MAGDGRGIQVVRLWNLERLNFSLSPDFFALQRDTERSTGSGSIVGLRKYEGLWRIDCGLWAKLCGL